MRIDWKVALAGLLALGVVLAVSSASTPSAPVGVTLLQFGCSLQFGVSYLNGPALVDVTGSGSCSNNGSNSAPPILVPAGRLYHLRVNAVVGTLDGSTSTVPFTVYDGGNATPLTCTAFIPPTLICDDTTHQYAVKSGDQLQIVANLPDSNTVMYSASATLEEALSQ